MSRPPASDRPPPAARTPRLRVVLPVFLLAIVAFLPSLRGGFLWDDDFHVTEKAALTEPGGLVLIWTRLDVSLYYPLTSTTFWVQRRLWGLDPLPYHAVNVLLHAANAGLLLLLLARLGVRGAPVAAAIWAVHPVMTESVAWITELKNVQSGLFFFLALLCWVESSSRGSRGAGRRYALAVLAGAAAMLSKSSTVVLPAVVLLLEWRRRGRISRADLARTAPLWIVAAVVSILTVVEQRGHVAGEGTGEWSLDAADRLAIAGKSLWFYATKLVWPARLSFVHPRWEGAVAWTSWLPLAAALGAGVALVSLRRVPAVRCALVSFAYFVLALLPVLGFFDVYFFRYSFVADHFQYLAAVGPIALAVALAASLLHGRLRAVGLAAAAIVILVLAGSTWRRCGVFRSDEALWRDTAEKSPGAWIAHNNLGNLLDRPGHREEGLAHLEEALRLRPDLPQIHSNLAGALASLERHSEAILRYREALRLAPGLLEARVGLGRSLAATGRPEEALAQFVEALGADPDLADVQAEAGAALDALGRTGEAVERYRMALALDPDQIVSLNNLAWTRATHPDPRYRDPGAAVRLAERAAGLAGDRVPDVLDTLAAAYARAGRFEEAVAVGERGVALARETGPAGLARSIERRVALYRERTPFTEDGR